MSRFDQISREVAENFSAEWTKFSNISPQFDKTFPQFFDLLDLSQLEGKVVLDAGCGMGRWAYYLANHCRELYCIDFSDAIHVARKNLSSFPNVHFLKGDLTRLPFREEVFDAIYSIGVLHHIPNHQVAFSELPRCLKQRGQLLTYIYYDLEGRPLAFKMAFWLAHILRLVISKFQTFISYPLCFLIALCVYLPLVFLGRTLSFFGFSKAAHYVPLYGFYHDKSFRILYNDAVDRFTTVFEKRFSRSDVEELYRSRYFVNIQFSNSPPLWKTIATKSKNV